SNKNTLNKKISFIFIVTALIQFIFIYVSMILFYAHSIYALIKAIYLSIASFICYAYIYKKIEEKVDYIEYIDRNIKDIEKGDL
ncbi:hypothetical protein L0M92_13630, partial [Casaltella massiliensis]|nr:hypothetical protein [Casaltella massiliensis]